MGAMAEEQGDEGLFSELKTDEQRLARILRWFENSTRANDVWRATVLEARRFVSGEQWTDEDRQARLSKRRPCLTINKILPRVLFLDGLQRSQRQEPKLLPYEGGDARQAQLMGALYKWAGTQSREATVDSKVFDDKIVGGLGYWKVSWSFEDDLEGELLWEWVDSLSVFPDPNWLDAGWKHAEYVIQATWMTIPQALAEWPEKAHEIREAGGEWLSESGSGMNRGRSGLGSGEFAGDPFSPERLFWDRETQRVRVLECWYKKREKVAAALHVSGDVTTDPARVDFLKRAVQVDPTLKGAITFAKVPVKRIYLAHAMQDVLLDDDESPYKPTSFPIFPTIGYYWHKTPSGVVKAMLDVQREGNVRRSTITEMVNASTLSGWKNHESQGAKKEDLEQFSAGVAKVINHRGAAPEEIIAPPIPQALVFLDSVTDKDLDAVTNIHAELLGRGSQRTVSGRALGLRQQSGLVVQEPLLESFMQDKEPAVRFSVELIQQFLSPPRALHILGSIAVRNDQSPIAQMLQQNPFAEVQDLLRGAFKQQYDIVIDAQSFQPSMLSQRWALISDMVEKFGEWVPPKLIVNAAKDAGILSESDAAEALEWVEQRVAAMMPQPGQAPPEAAPAAA